LTALTQSTLAGPGPGGAPPLPGFSIDSLIEGSLQAANINIAGAFANAISNGYSVLLPTADIANAVLISMPSYDLNLFLNGMLQVAHGDPMALSTPSVIRSRPTRHCLRSQAVGSSPSL